MIGIPPPDSPELAELQRAISRPLTPLEKRMVEDMRWAATAPEMRHHAGQVVAVWNKRVVAVGTDRQALRQQAAACEGCAEDEIVCVVVPGLNLAETPH